MSDYGFNNIDIAIFVVLFFSGLTAFFRGFTKEVLSILGWIIAALVTSRGLVFIQPTFRSMIKTETFADLAASAIIFLTTSIIWAILSGMLTKKLKKSSLGTIDKMLGLVFGFIRAGLLITLAYIFINFILPKEDMPKMITEAKSFKYIESSAGLLSNFAPDEIMSMKEKVVPEDILENMGTEDLYEKLIKPSVKGQDKSFDGYDESERENLDELFEETEALEETP